MNGTVKQRGYIVACLWVASLLPVTTYASRSEEDVVRKIRDIYARTYQLVEKKKTEIVIIYSEAGKDGYDVKRWHLAGDKQEYESGAYEVRVFIAEQRVIKTRVVVQSLSGDWADVIEYYYYQNGEPAFIFEGTTTYNGYVMKGNEKAEPDGPFVVEKRSYLSENGKIVKYIKKAYQKQSGKTVPITQIQDVKLAEYGSVCSLPFIGLVNERVKVCTK